MMNSRPHYLSVITIILMLNSLLGGTAQAGTEDMKATKRIIYQDETTETMSDVITRREAETKEYKQKVLSNGEKTIELLEEIRDLLQQLNEKD